MLFRSTDFAPYLLLLVCFSVCAFQRSIYRFTASAALASGICFGLALGITGPNDEFIQKQPARYVKIACWFRPSGPHQLLYNPQFSVDAEFSFPSSWSGRVPLFASGRVGSRFLLSAESVAPGRIRLVSETVLTSGPLGTAEVAFLPNQPNRLHAEYHPDTGLLTVQWNGEKTLRHKLPFLVTSPSQVSVGFERTAFAPRTETFPGTVMKRSVRMNGTEWP